VFELSLCTILQQRVEDVRSQKVERFYDNISRQMLAIAIHTNVAHARGTGSLNPMRCVFHDDAMLRPHS